MNQEDFVANLKILTRLNNNQYQIVFRILKRYFDCNEKYNKKRFLEDIARLIHLEY